MVKLTTVHKKKLLAIAQDLADRYGTCKSPPTGSFIELMMHQILLLGASDRLARKALASLQDEFVNWNDMRVGSVREIQDILGPRYPRYREKAEDLHHLLADFYTAFRKMELDDVVRSAEGIETLRALPETTLVREDMVEWALLHFCGVETFPCNEEQFELLRFLGGVPKNCEFEEGKQLLNDLCEHDLKTHLSIGLREHCDMLEQHDEYDPKPIDWGLPRKPTKPKRPSKAKTRTTATDTQSTGGPATTSSEDKQTAASSKTSKTSGKTASKGTTSGKTSSSSTPRRRKTQKKSEGTSKGSQS